MREFLQPSAPSILRLTPLKYGVCTTSCNPLLPFEEKGISWGRFLSLSVSYDIGILYYSVQIHYI